MCQNLNMNRKCSFTELGKFDCSHTFIHSAAHSHLRAAQYSQSLCCCCWPLCSLTAAAVRGVECLARGQLSHRWWMWKCDSFTICGAFSKNFTSYISDQMTVSLDTEVETRQFKCLQKCEEVVLTLCACFVVLFSPQALQALGYVLSVDGDVDSLSADEKSDGEGKNDRMSTSSSSTSVTSYTDTQEVRNTHTHTETLALWGLDSCTDGHRPAIWSDINHTSVRLIKIIQIVPLFSGLFCLFYRKCWWHPALFELGPFGQRC